MSNFLSEVKRREVIRPLIAYIGIAWLLLQVVDVLSGVITLHPLLAPGVLLFLICGLPVMAYLSWHFDISLEGIKRNPSLGNDETYTTEPFGFLNWTGLAVIALLSVFGGAQLFESIRDERMATEEGQVTIKQADAIAVLPFLDQSPDGDQGYLAVGIAEEITSLLGRIDTFRVMASRSGQILSDEGLAPVDIGRRLDVDAVLTGSIRASGSRLSIRVELLDTEDGRTLWTESFLRELKDIFNVEREISRAVVNLLQDEYLQSGAFADLSTTSSTDAYVMYLKGREAYRKQTTESMREARSLFEQSLAMDPEYAKVYVALADTLAALSEGGDGFGVLKPEIAATLAEENLNKAIVRQPELADIYAVMGVVNHLRNNFDDALGNFDKAIELNPSLAIAYMWKFGALSELQRFDEGIDALEKARELDPLFLTSTYNLGVMLSWRGRYEEAEALFRQMQSEFSDSPFPFIGLSDIYYGRGDFVGAIRELINAVSLSPDNEELVLSLASTILQLEMTEPFKQKASDPLWTKAVDALSDNILIAEDNFEALFERLEFSVAAKPGDYWTAFEAGWYQAMFGDEGKAIALLLRDSDTLPDTDKFAMPYCSPAIEIAWAHQQAGDDTASEQLLSRCAVLLREQRALSLRSVELDYLAARINALTGKNAEAVLALSAAVENGWREWWTGDDPLLGKLRDDADYRANIGIIQRDLERQRTEAAVLFADD
ncbi:MAG: tetratricopeptide repeat protein [Congregibacter sp.]